MSPRREPEQLMLFETYLCQVGAVRAYVQNIRQLVRMLPPAELDIAGSIERNALLIEQKALAAVRTHSEFVAAVGYKHLRKEK